jgi:DNA-damage-inducible protein J
MPDIIIHTDARTEKAVKSLCSSYGLSVSDAVNMILKKSIKEKELPIKAKKTRQFNAETLESFREIDEIKKNPHLYKGWTTNEEIRKGIEGE